MNDEDQAEYELLKLTNSRGKFAIQIGARMSADQCDALERLQLREWIKLIDVAPIAEHPDKVFRVFMLTAPAKAWIRKQAS